MWKECAYLVRRSMASDFNHIDAVLLLIPKLLTGTKSLDSVVVHQDLVRLTTSVR